MAHSKSTVLDGGYTAEVDAIDEASWSDALQRFDDANLYQTWSYGVVRSGSRNLSHLVLRKDGEIVAIAQARIARLPLLHAGVAYVQWGPLWRRSGFESNSDTLRQAVRALCNEFVCRRGLTLRLAPLLFETDGQNLSHVLAGEGFKPGGWHQRSRTVLMDLSPAVEDIRDGMRPHWKRELKIAERGGLKIIAGTGDDLFEAFIQIYHQMVARKHFVEPNDIAEFRRIQNGLPEALRMKIMLCTAGERVCAGLICSALGKTAVYLFGATSDAGMKSRGSYLLHWNLIQELKANGTLVYDLNGINPVRNPGTFKFKVDLAGRGGRDVCFLGPLDIHGSAISSTCARCGDLLRWSRGSLKGLRNTWGSEWLLKRAG